MNLVKSTYHKIVGLIRTEDSVTLYQRENLEIVKSFIIPAQFFILLKTENLLDGFAENFKLEKLSGDLFFQFVALFNNEKTLQSALKFLKTSTGVSANSNNAPYNAISDLDQQNLITQNFRLFSEMKFDDLLRMQIDIEVKTTEGFSFPNAERENDEIIIIAMKDSSGWNEILAGENEAILLQKMVENVQKRNPDVIEGHNIFNFDFTYIQTRAKFHKIKLNLGRDNSPISMRKSRFNIAEQTIDYSRFDIAGRSVIDTLHLVRIYDVVKREFESYGLKSVAEYFKISPENRTYIDGSEITKTFNENPELLKKYALDDVIETDGISKILLPSFFYQAQLIPLTLQNCLVRGNATRIESIFISEYFNQRHSISLPEPTRNFTGGLTESFHDGVFDNVWHADVRSLYPSIIIAKKLSPKNDQLKVFLSFLEKLREFRLEAKDSIKTATSSAEKDYFSALQGTFKILINSFYGYLGFGFGSFNDYQIAENVTATGREILTSMQNHLNKIGSKIIEMDTDGIYFQPPKDFSNSLEMMEKSIQSILPEGIEVELDSTYKTMFSYKSKNYALLHNDGKISLAGAALKSRGLERFQRNFMKELISYLLHHQKNEIPQLYQNYFQKLENHNFPLSEIVKTETLSGSIKSYQSKLQEGTGKRSAAYELAAKENREYRQGDQIKFYVIGNKKKVSVVENCKIFDVNNQVRDENVPYYQEKLRELYEKFSQFIPPKEAEKNQDLLLFIDSSDTSEIRLF